MPSASAGLIPLTGQLDAGPHQGRLEEVAAELMDYMIFAYKGGYDGVVCYEIERDESDQPAFVFWFDVTKNQVVPGLGEPQRTPVVRIRMAHSTFHRVFFASPSKFELGTLMMRGFIKVSNNDYREVANFASCYDYSRWAEFYRLREAKALPATTHAAIDAVRAKGVPAAVPTLMRDVSLPVPAGVDVWAVREWWSRGVRVQYNPGVGMLRCNANGTAENAAEREGIAHASIFGYWTCPRPSLHWYRLLDAPAQALNAAREHHAEHLRLLQSSPSSTCCLRSSNSSSSRYSGPGTPPSTGVVRPTTVAAALPSCAVTARISAHLHAHALILAAARPAPEPFAIDVELGAGQQALPQPSRRFGMVSIGIHSHGHELASAELSLPSGKSASSAAQSYWSSAVRWLNFGGWALSWWSASSSQ